MKKILASVLYLVMNVILLSLNTMEIQAETQLNVYSTQDQEISGSYESAIIVSDVSDITTSGTYEINSESGLIALSDFVNRGSGTVDYTFIQTSDITLSSGFTSIGKYKDNSPEYGFLGIYNGQDYTITIGDGNDFSFTPSTDVDSFNGIFGFVGSSGVIENLNIITASNIYVFDVDYASIAIGVNLGTVSGVSVIVENDIVTSGVYAFGVLVGYHVGDDAIGLISNSSITINSSLSLTGTLVGGFTGTNFRGTISNSSLTTNSGLTMTGEYVGGLVGYNDEGTISDSTLLLNDVFTLYGNDVESNIGGFVGQNRGSITNSSLTTNGDILMSAGNQQYVNVGGFVGYNRLGTITNSYLTTNGDTILSGYELGGFVGVNYTGTISNSYCTSSADLNLNGDIVGGFVGRNYGTITNAYLASKEELTLSGKTAIGGIVGDNNDTIDDVFIAADSLKIVPDSLDTNTGILFGSNWNEGPALISNSFAAIESTSGVSTIGIMFGTYVDWELVNVFYNAGQSWYEATGSGLDAITLGSGLNLADSMPESTSELISQVFNTSEITDSGISTLDGYSASTIYAPILYISGTSTLLPNQTLYDLDWLFHPIVEYTSISTTHSEIHSLALEETHHVELEFNELTIEVGAEVLYPTYEGYELYGYYKVDLTDDVEITGTVDTSTVGDYEITYTLNEYNDHTLVTDEDIEVLTVHVVDTTPPVITGSDAVRLVLDSNDYPEVTCMDAYSSCTLTQDMELDSSTLGTKVITYTGVDESGNETNFVQTVTVEVPVVETKVISVGTQDFVFPLSERDYDLENITVKVLVSDEVPSANDENWMIYAEQEITTKENELVYLMVSDGTNYVIKSTVSKQVSVVVEPEPETQSTDTTDSISAVVVVDESGMTLWWLWIILVVAVIVVGRRYIVSKKL